MTPNHIVEASGITKKFGAFTAVSGVSAKFERGKITSVIGPNGAGKSTFFNMLSGSLVPSEGKVIFDGKDITGLAQHQFAPLGIAKSFQITSVFPQLSVLENVRLAAQALVSRYDFWTPRTSLTELKSFAEGLLEQVGLSGRLNAIAGTLAHGEQRALEIAMALASKPKLLLLDEPTAGMSPEETLSMMKLIQKLAESRTVILVEHKMKLVMGVSDQILVLHHGELIASGTPDDIRTNEQVRRVYLGERQH
jgi:branched-chain amino acid transport system ATP-binding protein